MVLANMHERKALEIGRMMLEIWDLEAEAEASYEGWMWHAEEMIDGDICLGECYGDEQWSRYVQADEDLSCAKAQLARLLDEERLIERSREDWSACAIASHISRRLMSRMRPAASTSSRMSFGKRLSGGTRGVSGSGSRLARGRSDAALVRSRVVRKTAKLRAVARRFERRRARRRKAAA